jgi:UbiA prenyltransferase family
MGRSGSISLQPFRADDWWTSKAALLMGLVYLYTWWFGISLERFMPLCFFSVMVIAGFASFGYLVNDFFDREQDRRAGKKNFMLDRPASQQLALAFVSILLIVGPWFYLPIDRFSYTLIAIQLSLFLIYSIPPLRLKERGAAGLVVDSLYAHAVPALLAAYSYHLAARSPLNYPEFTLLFLWQLSGGLRNILIHQSEDRGRDQQSDTRTFVATAPERQVLRLLQAILLSELIFCLAFFSILTYVDHSFAACLVAVFVLSFQPAFWYMFLTKSSMPDPPLRYFPNNVYEKWLPVVCLIVLSFSNPWFLVVLLMHVTLFNFDLYHRAGYAVVQLWRGIPFGYMYYALLLPIRIFISRVVNYAIYYTLRIFGIDLRKENSSALDYFKKRMGKEK